MAGLAHRPAPTLDRTPTILVFDSGLGGLTVHREIVAARPDARFIYCADDAAFPYGALTEQDLIARVVAVVGHLIHQHQPDCVVIACNTASTLVLQPLRDRFALPFVGTVPAIKPACAASLSRMVSVLATPGTVKRDYTRALIAEFGGGCDVTLVGAPHLARLAEAVLAGSEPDLDAIAAEIAPCFVEREGVRTDTIVLGCTHYPLLMPMLRDLAPWPVTFLDPAPAIARRVIDLIGASTRERVGPESIAILTGGKAAPTLAPVFEGFGLTRTVVEALPLQ